MSDFKFFGENFFGGGGGLGLKAITFKVLVSCFADANAGLGMGSR